MGHHVYEEIQNGAVLQRFYDLTKQTNFDD